MVTGAAALPRDGPSAAFGGGVGVGARVGDGEGAERPTPPNATRIPPRSSAPASAAARYPSAMAGPRPARAVAGGGPVGTTGSVGTKSTGSASGLVLDGSAASVACRASASGGRDSVMGAVSYTHLT